jgi:hypothetical protein
MYIINHTYIGDGYGPIFDASILFPAAHAHKRWFCVLLAVVLGDWDLTGLGEETPCRGVDHGLHRCLGNTAR